MFADFARLAEALTLCVSMERLARLAFRAQGQCRTTVETLAFTKQGPRTAVFAKQAKSPPARSRRPNRQVFLDFFGMEITWK